MTKIGRNAPCPCGGGKKFKKCCGSPVETIAGIPLKEVQNIILYPGTRQSIIISKTIVENQLRRDGPKIAESFDLLFGDHIKDISEEYGRIVSLLSSIMGSEIPDKLHLECFILLFNISQTIIAALDCLRHGYLFQPGILLRNVIESICTALHLFSKPEDLNSYVSGTLESTKTIAQAKKVLPHLGKLYGYFSEEFAHLGSLQRKFSRLSFFKDKQDAAALLNLSLISMATNLLYIAAELIFYKYVPVSRYWKKIGPGSYMYEPSGEEKSWQEKFLKK